MDISQTSVAKGKDESANKDDQVDQPDGGYYYDDTTGYEIYDEENEPEEEDVDNTEA
jgi:ribosomal 30S subunit maturation factor RimM